MEGIILPVFVFVFGVTLTTNIRGVGHLVGAYFRLRILRRWVRSGDDGQILSGRVLGTFICALSGMAGASGLLVHGGTPPTTLDSVLIVFFGVVGIAVGITTWRLALPGGRLERLSSGALAEGPAGKLIARKRRPGRPHDPRS